MAITSPGTNSVHQKMVVAPVDEDTGVSEIRVKRGIGPPGRVWAVFLCGAFAFLDLYCTQPLLPLLARIFHASETRVGLTISASTLGVAISAVLLAIFAERVDRKRIILWAMTALAVTAALTATAPNLGSLAVWRFAQGLLTPGIFIITIAYITEEWAPLQVPRVMSVYVAGTVFGGFVGRVAGGTLATHYGWRWMFLILGIAGAFGAAITRRLLKAPAPKPAPAQISSRWQPLLNNLRNPRLLVTFGIGFCMLFTLVSVFSYITFYLAEAPFGLSTTELSWLFSVYLVGLVVTLGAGTILARVGLRHGMLTAVGLCFGGVVLTLIHSLFAVGVGLSLASSGVFIAQTCANSFVRDAAPEGSRVSAAGMYICSYYVGGTAGGILPGLIWKTAGWPGCAALTCSFLCVAGLLALFGWRKKSAAPEPIPL
jgi:predicted MFS family arabinose efflux permease